MQSKRKHKRNLTIVRMRRAGHTLRSIGRRYRITRERVRQIVCAYTRSKSKS
jgi:DNA-directed RNA polymerase sigma subunit (sigma70/sigma32)